MRCYPLSSLSGVERDVGFEDQPFGSRELEYYEPDHFPGALTDTDICGAVLARVSPVDVIRRVFRVGGQSAEVVKHILDFDLADALHELLELFLALPFLDVTIRQSVKGLGHVFRRNRDDRKSVRGCVVFPFTTEDDLEVWHLVSVDAATHAVESNVTDVVLAATVEAAAHFDVKIMN